MNVKRCHVHWIASVRWLSGGWRWHIFSRLNFNQDFSHLSIHFRSWNWWTASSATSSSMLWWSRHSMDISLPAKINSRLFHAWKGKYSVYSIRCDWNATYKCDRLSAAAMKTLFSLTSHFRESRDVRIHKRYTELNYFVVFFFANFVFFVRELIVLLHFRIIVADEVWKQARNWRADLDRIFKCFATIYANAVNHPRTKMMMIFECWLELVIIIIFLALLTNYRLRSFGVKPIMDYSVEEDLSQEEAEEREMEASKPAAPGAQAPADVAPHSPQFSVDKSFADRRFKVQSARTYFYLNEATCEKNMETFIQCLEAVANSTFGTGITAIKLTALGRPNLLVRWYCRLKLFSLF